MLIQVLFYFVRNLRKSFEFKIAEIKPIKCKIINQKVKQKTTSLEQLKNSNNIFKIQVNFTIILYLTV